MRIGYLRLGLCLLAICAHSHMLVRVAPYKPALRTYGVEWDRHIPRVGMLGYHRHLGGTSWTTFVTMPITRSQSAGAYDAAHPEEVETSATSGSSEVRDLRTQLAVLTDLLAQQTAAAQRQAEVAQRQEARMKHLEDLLLQQAAASRETQVPTPPAPVVDVAPRAQSPAPSSSRAAPATASREEVAVAPPVQRPAAGMAFPVMAEGAERDRLMDRLSEFRRCSPRTFDGENADHWIVEKWLMHMEKLFRDTFVEERDRVWLATHFLDGEAYRWWLDIQDNPTPTWQRLLGRVAEYEREFSRLLHCVPFVVRDDEDKARIFERGLRPSIFRLVQSSNLQTYREVVDRALIVEAGAADLQERREGSEKGKGKRPAAEVASQTHSRRPPRHPGAGASRGDVARLLSEEDPIVARLPAA
uniref:Retrotransposon gag domain-containing protein n=1 Tax=Ananas comosus var. bracteatus TaxID=296719 RepID=A0A6V7Q3M9_ANACO|nr:unnamed protein product [Ananas comosus var. bracteatus]